MSQVFERSKSDREIISELSSRQRIAKLSDIILVMAAFGVVICPICTVIGWMIWTRYLVIGMILTALFAVLTVVCVLICVFLSKSVKKQKAKIKELTGQYIIKGVLAEKIDITEYSPNQYINEKFVRKCSILPNYNRISGSDYISGNYRGRKFIYCDLLLEWKSKDSDEHTSTTTMFKGQLMKMELGKDIGGFVRIRERENPRRSNGFFANIFGTFNPHNSIETENAAFNNQFEIKTSDDQLAFYILTPQFMESIIRLDKLADGYTNIEFCGTSVVLTFNNGRDSFEVKKTLRSKRKLEKYRQSFREELSIILGVFDEVLTKENLF